LRKNLQVLVCGVILLAEALKSGMPVVVKLGSDNCPPCRKMNPIMQELAAEQKSKTIFLNLDVYENRDLAKKTGVRVIPTMLYYDKRGKLKAKSEGGMTREQILRTIKGLKLNQ
jgi:thioredoxin 1